MESTTELKNQRALTVFLGVVLVGLITYFGIIPLIKSIQEEKINYLKLQYSINEEKKIVGDLADLTKEYKKYEESTFKKLNKILPDNIDQSIILVQLDALAFSNGASLQSLNFGTPTQVIFGAKNIQQTQETQETQQTQQTQQTQATQEIRGNVEGTTGTTINSIPINISIVGNYLSIKNFLNALYRNLRLFEVDSVNFQSPQKSEKGEVLYTVNISLKTFYKGQPEKTEELSGEATSSPSPSPSSTF